MRQPCDHTTRSRLTALRACNWSKSVAILLGSVPSSRFFDRAGSETAAPVPTASLPRVDAAFGLRIATALRQVVDAAVNSGGWAHFQQCGHLTPYATLATAITGMGTKFSLTQQTQLVALYTEKTIAFLTEIDRLTGDPALKCYIETKTIIQKMIKVTEELKLRTQDTRRIALLSAVLALVFRVPNYNRISTAQSLNLCTTKPVGIGASRDAFGILKCGARLLLKMLQAIMTVSGAEAENGRNLFVLLALTDIVGEWCDRKPWLIPEQAAVKAKYLERFQLSSAALATALHSDVLGAAVPVYRGEDGALTEAIQRENPSCAVTGPAGPSLQEKRLEELLKEARQEARRERMVNSTLEEELRSLKRKLEEFQGGPSTSGEAAPAVEQEEPAAEQEEPAAEQEASATDEEMAAVSEDQ